MATQAKLERRRVSDRLEGWLSGDQPKTLGGLIDVFGEGSFAIIFVLLMALPARWRKLELGGSSRQKFINVLLRRIRGLERFSRPRATWLFGHRLSGSVFGVVVLGLTLSAFLAPPFSGLDTLPSIGVVVLALGYLLSDIVLVAAGVVIGAAGVASVAFLGSVAVKAVKSLF